MEATFEPPVPVDLDRLRGPEEEDEAYNAAVLAAQKALAALATNEDKANTPLIAELKELAIALKGKVEEKLPTAKEEELNHQMEELIFEPSPKDETLFNLS